MRWLGRGGGRGWRRAICAFSEFLAFGGRSLLWVVSVRDGFVRSAEAVVDDLAGLEDGFDRLVDRSES